MKQTILPRTAEPPEMRMDWGTKRRLVMATPNKRALLFITSGYSMSMGFRGGGLTYVPAALHLVSPSDRSGRRLAEGRISKQTFRANAEVIDDVFGRGAAAECHPRKTLWVTEAGFVEIV